MKLSEIPDHLYKTLITGSFGSGKSNTLPNLINHEPDNDKIKLHAKHPFEAKYQLLLKKREITGLKHLNDPKVFIEYSNDMDDIHKNLNKKQKHINRI